MSAAPTTASKPRTFLAFDFGLRRIGVASGNSLTGHAEPLTTLTSQSALRFEAIARLIAEWRPDALVIGVPFHPDGAAHVNTLRARRFGRQLQGRFGLPVHEADERYTTTEAAGDTATEVGAVRAADLDARAAAIILEQYLRSAVGAKH